MVHKKEYIIPAIEQIEMDTTGVLAASTNMPQLLDDNFDLLPDTNEAYGGEFC